PQEARKVQKPEEEWWVFSLEGSAFCKTAQSGRQGQSQQSARGQQTSAISVMIVGICQLVSIISQGRPRAATGRMERRTRACGERSSTFLGRTSARAKKGYVKPLIYSRRPL